MSVVCREAGLMAIVVVVALCLFEAIAAAADDIDGVFGFTSGDEETYLAVWVPLDPGRAVRGIEWYNNDSLSSIASVQAWPGDSGGPQAEPEFVLVAEDANGESLAWSYVEFESPLATYGEGLYIGFCLQSESGFTCEGEGGGLGFGYSATRGSQLSWVGNGEGSWYLIGEPFYVAVEPVYAQDKAGDYLFVDEEQSSCSESRDLLVAVGGVCAFPNPFNPSVTLRYSLECSGMVRVQVVDVRGRLVCELLGEHRDAGEHTVVWDGTDDDGSRVAAGCYFVTVTGASAPSATKIVLVK